VTLPATQDFQFIGGALALDLVNTVSNRLGASRDYLADADELLCWARLAGLVAGDADRSDAARQLKQVRAVREDLHRLFQSLALGALEPGEAALDALSRRLRPVLAERRLALRDGAVVWTGSVAEDFTPLVLLDAADLLTSGAWRRLRQCEGETCGWLFLDRSKSGRRRWCSMADCGNREKARRHYHRTAAARS
jgi:predicted RNA-binding Zn ribbon-like protein